MGATLERGRWRARVTHQGKRVNLGFFDTKLKATRAINKFKREHSEPMTQLQMNYVFDDSPMFSSNEQITFNKPSLKERLVGKIRAWKR